MIIMAKIEPWLMKRPAAIHAVDTYLKDGMTVGLGTGNAAKMAIDRIVQYVSEGYDLRFVSTSLDTDMYVREKGLSLTDINDVDLIDVTFDGADEVSPDLILIKGLGGALLKEKIVAELTDREIIIVDDFKNVDVLGIKTPLPVEVCKYGHKRTADRLSELGCEPSLRMKDEQPFVTDEGHLIYDCKFPSIRGPKDLLKKIESISGVVTCGLFIDMVHAVVSYCEDGTVRESLKGNQNTY